MLDFSLLRPPAKYPKYPGSYVNEEEYIESYFFNFYKKNILDKGLKLDRLYIPIWWTNLFVDNHQIDVQRYINALDWTQKWFTVCQMDDGVRYKLPPDTLVFNAGGDSGHGNRVPIPLIASPIPDALKTPNKPKDYLASFVGSMTHPIRQLVYEQCKNYKDFYFNPPRAWSQVVSDEALNEFIDVTERSAFCISPEGYGMSNFRNYQAFELGVVPVYISSRKHWLPWEDSLKWHDFCVIIKPDQIYRMHDILMEIYNDKERYNGMLKKAKELYNDWFTLEGTCNQILKRL